MGYMAIIIILPAVTGIGIDFPPLFLLLLPFCFKNHNCGFFKWLAKPGTDGRPLEHQREEIRKALKKKISVLEVRL